MKTEEKMVTKLDFQRLSNLIEKFAGQARPVMELEDKLASMRVLDASEIPKDLITMNTKVMCAFEPESAPLQQSVETFQLVYPNQANLENGSLSILTPLGVALLGVRPGEKTNWVGRDGCKRTLLVQSILYQPEANGDWHL